MEINLLPWRQVKHDKNKKVLAISLLCLLTVLFSLFFEANYFFKKIIKRQSNFNLQLRAEIALLDIKIKKLSALREMQHLLLAQINTVQDLVKKQTLNMHLFVELAKIMPPSVYLIKIQKHGNEITMHGYAKLNNQISKLMRRITKNAWLENPRLTSLKKEKTKLGIITRIRFTLDLTLKCALNSC